MIRYLLHLSLLFPLLWQLVNMLLKFCIYVRLKVTLTCFGDNFLCQRKLNWYGQDMYTTIRLL